MCKWVISYTGLQYTEQISPPGLPCVDSFPSEILQQTITTSFQGEILCLSSCVFIFSLRLDYRVLEQKSVWLTDWIYFSQGRKINLWFFNFTVMRKQYAFSRNYFDFWILSFPRARNMGKDTSSRCWVASPSSPPAMRPHQETADRCNHHGPRKALCFPLSVQ